MSHSEPESPRDLAAAYALGALGPEEARLFEAYLADSPAAQRDVAEFRDVAALLALSGPESAMGSDLRHRLIERVRADTDRPIRAGFERTVATRVPPILWGALAASIIAVFGLGAAYLSLRGDVVRSGQMLAEREQQLQARENTLNSILEPGVELYQLTARGDPEPGVQLFWDRRRNSAFIHGFRLKPVAPGKAYQLWFIKEGKPMPSVTFTPDPSGQVKLERVSVPAGNKVSAAAVTVEPVTGSPQPTSPILFLGQLQKS